MGIHTGERSRSCPVCFEMFSNLYLSKSIVSLLLKQRYEATFFVIFKLNTQSMLEKNKAVQKQSQNNLNLTYFVTIFS